MSATLLSKTGISNADVTLASLRQHDIFDLMLTYVTFCLKIRACETCIQIEFRQLMFKQ